MRRRSPLSGSARRLGALALAAAALAGCRQDMHNNPRVEPYEGSRFFADGEGMRPPVAGTVARGRLADDPLRDRGLDPSGQGFAKAYPMPVNAEVLRRGRERYDIFCAPCHDRTGSGRGMIVRRGFKQPSSFHVERLRNEAPGYYFDVITNGFGQMSSYAAQVPTDDRWAIAAYIRALQLSQYAPTEVLGDAERAELANAPDVVERPASPAAPKLTPFQGVDPFHGAAPIEPQGRTGEAPHSPVENR
jgi:hypothetical protein